jgi:Uma2 family endonuclease
LDEALCRQIEIVDGYPVYCAAPSRQHNRAARRLANMLEEGARKHTARVGGCLGVDTDVDLRMHDVPLLNRRPDVVLYHCLESDEVLRPADVLLILEIVSPGSETTDRVTKFKEYAKAGVPHYWIVRLGPEFPASVPNRVATIELYRLDPAQDGYLHDRTIFHSDARLADLISSPIDMIINWTELTDLTVG